MLDDDYFDDDYDDDYLRPQERNLLSELVDRLSESVQIDESLLKEVGLTVSSISFVPKNNRNVPLYAYAEIKPFKDTHTPIFIDPYPGVAPIMHIRIVGKRNGIKATAVGRVCPEEQSPFSPYSAYAEFQFPLIKQLVKGETAIVWFTDIKAKS